MKKLLITCILLTISTVLFTQENEEKTVKVIQAKRSIRPQLLLGIGFDLLFGTDSTQQKTSTVNDPNTFTESNKNTNDNKYDAGIMGDIYFLIGSRMFRNLDVYGRLAVNYAFINQNLELKTGGKKDYIFYNRFDFNIDANTRYNFLFGSFGPYLGLGLGTAFNISESIEWYKYDKDDDKYKSTTLQNNSNKVKVHFYTNLGLGFLFKSRYNTAFSFGYSMRYYFSSIFNEDGDKILKKKNGQTAKVSFGDNQILHGINMEFSTTF